MSALSEGLRGSNDMLGLGDSTNHWHQFGLERSPFDDSLTVYYPVQQWEEHLSFMQRFRAGPYPLLLIPGIVGSGKTTLVKRFLDSQNDHARMHYIEAQPHFALHDLIRALYSGSGLAPHADTNTPEILNQLSALANDVGSQLLVIDDAHRLPRETLMRLLHLLFAQDIEQSQCRVMLCGESQLQETVMTLLDTFASGRQVPSLDLQPLSLQEVREYLEFRFAHAGQSRKHPFTPALLKQVHILSGGFPGRVNRVAQQVIVDSMRFERLPSGVVDQCNQYVQAHKMKLMSAALFFGVVLLMWQLQPTHHATRSMVADQATANLAALSAAAKAPAEKSISGSELATDTSTTGAPAQLSSEMRAAIAAAVDHMQAVEMSETGQYEESFSMPVVHNQHLCAGATLSDTGTYLADRTVKKPDPAIELADKSSSQRVPTTIAAADSTPQLIPTTDVNPADSSAQKISTATIASADSVTGAELQLMAAKGYTIQIMGVRVPQLLDAFVAENNLTDVSYYRTKMNNQDWYVLVCGSFQSQDEAKAALAKLPEEVRRQQPWVRSFEGVRQAIELAHQKEITKERSRVAIR